MTEVGGGRFGPEGDSLSPVAYVIGGVAQTFREFLPSRGNAAGRRGSTRRPAPNRVILRRETRRAGGPKTPPPLEGSGRARPSRARRVPLVTSGGATGRPAGPGWPARACSCRPAAGSGPC